MIVHVTYDDIKHGVPRHARLCPVAQAIGRTLGVHCRVGQRMILVGHVEYPTDPTLFAWLATFDFSRPVKPITIELIDDPSTLPIERIARIVQTGSPESSTP